MGVCFRDSLRDLALAQCQDDGVPAVAVLVGAGVVVEPPVVVPPLPPVSYAMRPVRRGATCAGLRRASDHRGEDRARRVRPGCDPNAASAAPCSCVRSCLSCAILPLFKSCQRRSDPGSTVCIWPHCAHRTVQSLTSLPTALAHRFALRSAAAANRRSTQRRAADAGARGSCRWRAAKGFCAAREAIRAVVVVMVMVVMFVMMDHGVIAVMPSGAPL